MTCCSGLRHLAVDQNESRTQNRSATLPVTTPLRFRSAPPESGGEPRNTRLPSSNEEGPTPLRRGVVFTGA
jgi:hypothetical protein